LEGLKNSKTIANAKPCVSSTVNKALFCIATKCITKTPKNLGDSLICPTIQTITTKLKILKNIPKLPQFINPSAMIPVLARIDSILKTSSPIILAGGNSNGYSRNGFRPVCDQYVKLLS